jgi:5-formyltetrahydrofolate cyclo-ligase
MGKDELRASVLERRRTRAAEELDAAAEAIAAHLLAAPFARVERVAAYLSMATEPGTGPLLAGLHAQGVEVIVPVTAPEHQLDWVLWSPYLTVTMSALGVPEPSGETLGAEALSRAGLVIIPALAVDHDGHRLGRGAGYYDRALAAVRAPRCALVFADELVEHVPHSDHDVPVDLVVSPPGIFRVPQ